jgi:surface polysaccharide O-acyltransferase-like enzyme
LFHKISTPAKSSRRIRPFTSELGDHFVVIIFWHFLFFTFLKACPGWWSNPGFSIISPHSFAAP